MKDIRYSLLLKGGFVVDPSQHLEGVRDVAFSGGKVALVADCIPEDMASEVFDATGFIVVPGLIDLHVHAFWGASDWGVEPDPTMLAQGVTTALDAGTAGVCNFAAFRKYVLERCATRLYALLNISSLGIPSHRVGELYDLRWVDVKRAIELARENREYVRGIKARLGKAQAAANDVEALKRAIDVAEALDQFVMIHIGNTATPLQELVAMLRPGDVVTHCFHGLPHGILDDSGLIIDEIQEAQRRGVVFDVGHGVGSFSFGAVERALSQGFFPESISSDLHSYSIRGTVPDHLTVLSKFMHLGMTLTDVIRLSTHSPARVLGMSDKLGTLRVAAEGDAAVLKVQEGEFTLTDTVGVSVKASRKLTHVCAVRGGKIYRPWLGALQTMEAMRPTMWQEIL